MNSSIVYMCICLCFPVFLTLSSQDPDELARITWQMRQGNTPAVISKWVKSCRAHQGKAVKQERARRRDARYTKAK